TGTTIAGNEIGTDPSGTIALAAPGSTGVALASPSEAVTGNVIGGTTPAARNVISGNSGSGTFGLGIELDGAGVTGNVVEGNFIGTDVTGDAVLSNNIGVYVADGADGNTIGGLAPGAQSVVTAGGKLTDVYGVVVAANGDLITADPFNARLVRVNP